ncbi:lipoprotein-anchoring transpeptidase ErfK/SrfK [Clostridium moniliforme]|uniref:Lipoprotein-anchoring transpeptidase ErfK/SrfK n=1 Tax=Clostridium moniliforme TaxID=39489 RepID=A0ABS4F231_9CLOT|nr:L,D-transpeptidase [Clostridium moniliforme]MBP1890147.1 lipoprotein-anchoring transpeptidase ErfK/SrfK [Clostridium moniliforme]
MLNIKNKDKNSSESNKLKSNFKLKDKINFKKLGLIFSFITLIIGSILAYQAFMYNSFINTFKDYFNSNEYITANNHIIFNENSNIFKTFMLKNDLSKYFESKLNSLNEISSNDAITIINEIKKYDVLTKDNVAPVNTNSDSNLSKGVSLFNEGKFEDAINILNKIENTDSDYKISLDYISKCKTKIKEDLLKQVNEYKEKEYFTAAINLIENKLNILSNDKELLQKIEELKSAKDTYLANNKNSSVATSSQIVSAINVSNINTLDIESLTDYLVYVDTASQNTNVYTGSKNKWALKKSMKCSTGVKDKETPSGVYTVQNRDTWFFSEKFKQGGKYWVQFDGDYLFHSVPYDKDQKTVLDTTLGTPASHGCIRLSLEDSKWLYDTLPKGSKIIIK